MEWNQARIGAGFFSSPAPLFTVPCSASASSSALLMANPACIPSAAAAITSCKPRLAFAKGHRFIRRKLLASDLQEFRRRNPVAAEIAVHGVRGGVPWLSRVTHQHAAQTAPQNQRRAEPRRPAADDDHIEKTVALAKRRMVGIGFTHERKKWVSTAGGNRLAPERETDYLSAAMLFGLKHLAPSLAPSNPA